MIRLAVALVLLLAFARAARAETEDPLWTEAKRLKDIAAESYRRGEYETALDYLRQAVRLFPSPNLQFDLGLALTKLDRDPEAADAFELYLARGKDIPAALRTAAQAQLQRIGQKLARLELTCSVEQAEVLVDGKPRGTTPLAGPLRVEAGARTVRVAKAGYTPSIQEVSLAAGEERRITVELERQPAEPPVEKPAPPKLAPLTQIAAPPPAPPPPLYRRGWFWGVVLGAAALVGGALALGLTLGRPAMVRTLPDIVPQ